MNIKFTNKILTILIILTGIFIYQMPGIVHISKIPQFLFLILAGGILLSLTIDNLYLKLISLLMFINFFTSSLSNKNPINDIYDASLTIFSAICIYNFFVKHNINLVKFLIIPALINSIVIYIQYFFPALLPLKHEVLGLLGNAGFTSCFIGITAPIFLQYFWLGLPIIFGALILAKGMTGIIAFITSILFYLWFKKKKLFFIFLCISLLLAIISLISFNIVSIEEINFRISSILGTLHGTLNHWFKGWGIGSFNSMMSLVPPKESIYYKVPFNTANATLNHPANEFLFGWWNFGIAFPILAVLYIKSLFKKFDVKKLTLFSVLIGCLAISLFFMFTPATLFVAMMCLGLYENKEVLNANYSA